MESCGVADEGDCMAIVDALLVHFLNVELFRGLKPLQITEIARTAERVVFRPGQLLIEHGRPGNAALLVASEGAVRVLGPGGDSLNEAIEPGSLIAEMAMLIEIEHSSTVLAKGSVRAFRITRDSMECQMRQDAALAEHFVDKIAGKLHGLAGELRRIEAAVASTGSDQATAGADRSEPHAISA
jgi:CRP-like cAMP-binding protein